MKLLGKPFGAVMIAALAITAVPAQAGLFDWLTRDPFQAEKDRIKAYEARQEQVRKEWNAKVAREMKDGTSPFLDAGKPLSEGALEMRLWKLETGVYDPD